jgi:hypothetical protein
VDFKHKEKIMKRETKRTLYVFSIALMCAAVGVLSGCADQKGRMQTEAQGSGGQLPDRMGRKQERGKQAEIQNRL